MKPKEIPTLSKQNITNFWNKVNKTDNCWLWVAGKNHRGYGRFNIKNKPCAVHRVSYTIHKGTIPSNMEIDHLCKIRNCINPKHLEAVTHQENVSRSNSGIRQKEKTHCPHGHEYTQENTIKHKNNKCKLGYTRECRACRENRRKKDV